MPFNHPDEESFFPSGPTRPSSLGFSFFFFVLVWLFGFLLLTEPAWAIQSHSAPEGLYVHQIAHFFFVVSMAFLAYWLAVNHLTSQKGWRYIQIAAILFLLWNIVAVAGHWVEEQVPRELFVGDPDWSQKLIQGTNIWANLFYVLKLDHLICVPAIVCLFLGIKSLYQDVLRQGSSDRV